MLSTSQFERPPAADAIFGTMLYLSLSYYRAIDLLRWHRKPTNHPVEVRSCELSGRMRCRGEFHHDRFVVAPKFRVSYRGKVLGAMPHDRRSVLVNTCW